MEANEAINAVKSLVDANGTLEVSWTDPKIADLLPMLKRAKVRSELSHDGIIVNIDVQNSMVKIFKMGAATAVNTASATSAPKEVKPVAPPTKRTQHTYVAPHFDSEVKALLADVVPHNIWFFGPTGSGKTEYVHHLAAQIGYVVYQINGKQDMATAGFVGDKSIVIDEDSKQNFIKFMEGPVIKAMQQGLDEKGNEVGAPGLLFIDEVAALPSHILIALNRVLENRKARREVALDADGGRVIRSHSKFRVICAGNTIGRGFTGMNDALYSAQGDALDISTLNRFGAFFRFGYNKKAEKQILQEKTGDDRITNQILKFRDAIRGFIKQGKLTTPFSTRTIVAVADSFRVFGSLSKALYFSVFNSLPNEERAVYNEQCVACLGIDVLKDHENQNDMDYM
jgi:MoxR-like ATPase